LKAFIIGLIIGVIAVPMAVYFYFSTGSAPVATSAPPMPFEKMFAHMALDAKIKKEMPKTVPIAANESTYLAGAQLYQQHCAVCHGLPNQERTAISQGMYPRPPQLFKGKGVTDDEPGETYWKVTNGIRMTGMPGFDKSLSDTQRWQISLLLANANKLPPSVMQALAPPPQMASTPAAPTGAKTSMH
jgi:thiosulfate dehydrogenase